MEKDRQTPISNRGFDAQFLCMVPRNNALILDGIVTSIDSLRVKFTYRKKTLVGTSGAPKPTDTLVLLLESLTATSLWMLGDFDIDAGRETNFKIGNYMRTITFKLNDGNSFAVLIGRYCYDSSVKQIAPEVIMDFNPNKIPEKIWKRIASILAPIAQKIEVQRYDLAVDLPVNRKQLELAQRPGSGYQKFISPDGKAVTEYTGERSHHAAIKLYDKGADLGLTDLTCTRCEITIEPKKFKGISQLWPTILYMAPVALSTGFSDLPYEVQSVILCPELLPVLKAKVNRNTFAKYKKMIESYGHTFYTLSDQQAQQIDQYVRNYLASLVSSESLVLTVH